MPNTLKTLAQSKVAANKAVKAAGIATAEKAIGQLEAALKQAKQREAAQADQKRQENAKKIASMMSNLGVSVADISGLTGTKKGRGRPAKKIATKKRAKVAPKYRLKAGGQTHEWSGRGRTPVVFRDFVAQGGKLESCLIR